MISVQSAYALFAVPATLISIALSVSVEVSNNGQPSESLLGLREQPLASLTQSIVFIQKTVHQTQQVEVDLVSEKLKPEGQQKFEFADSNPATQESNAPQLTILAAPRSQASNSTNSTNDDPGQGDPSSDQTPVIDRTAYKKDWTTEWRQGPPKQNDELEESDTVGRLKSSANRLFHRSAVVIGVACAFAGLQSQPRAAVLMSI